MERRFAAHEWLDARECSPEDVAGNLDDMERLLSLLGVGRRVVRFLNSLELPSRSPLRLLDLATGSGWLPRQLLRYADRSGMELEVTAIDANPLAIAHARACTTSRQHVEFQVADARRLERVPGAYHIVTCTMALHHFAGADAEQLLGTIAATASHGWFVCDLLRSRAAHELARLATRLTSGNPLTRHDGPLTVRRAFSMNELRSFVRRTGIHRARVERFSLICGAVWGRDRETARC
jgi:2-polyprenyl-3-methyl-5-hydroxy-6-metoxy-1,4-benzoquinol methylase